MIIFCFLYLFIFTFFLVYELSLVAAVEVILRIHRENCKAQSQMARLLMYHIYSQNWLGFFSSCILLFLYQLEVLNEI